MQPAAGTRGYGAVHISSLQDDLAATLGERVNTILDECASRPRVGPEALGPASTSFTSLLQGDAAVAAAVVGEIAVTGPEGEEIPIAMTNAQVKNYDTQGKGHKGTNEAMKFMRDHVCEKNVRGVPSVRALELTHAHLGGGLSIPKMSKPKNTGTDEGMDYAFDIQEVRAVDWKAMIANLPHANMEEMLGLNHVCRMTLEWVPNAYDCKRRHMATRCKRWTAFSKDVPVYQWDYHLLLSDGSVWRFHTDWKVKKASIKLVKPGDKLPPPPEKGINESDGPVSYRRYKIGNYQDAEASAVVVEAEIVVVAAESAVAEAETTPEVAAEAGTAASSSNALGSHTVAPTEMDSPAEMESAELRIYRRIMEARPDGLFVCPADSVMERFDQTPFHWNVETWQSGQQTPPTETPQSAVAELCPAVAATQWSPWYTNPSGTMSRYASVPNTEQRTTTYQAMTVDNNRQQERVIDSNASHRTIVEEQEDNVEEAGGGSYPSILYIPAKAPPPFQPRSATRCKATAKRGPPQNCPDCHPQQEITGSVQDWDNSRLRGTRVQWCQSNDDRSNR